MLDWKEAAPLIGVILAAVFGALGLVISSKRREASATAAVGSVPSAIAGAVAERGLAEGLTMAVTALTAVLQRGLEEAERDRDREQEERRRQFGDVREELQKLRLAIEAQGRR